ncbi:hypothetical protein ABTX77_40490, partial [Streptomyces sp. NPDC097704]|uniref:hypothetical protein n=1 Tax=Streptomyces sp. NPDC097704 TaxID=3157101 RepID=UPI00333148C0
AQAGPTGHSSDPHAPRQVIINEQDPLSQQALVLVHEGETRRRSHPTGQQHGPSSGNSLTPLTDGRPLKPAPADSASALHERAAPADNTHDAR